MPLTGSPEAVLPSLLGWRTHVHEFSAGQVGEFLRGRLPSEDRIAMRMTTEVGNYVSMSTRLRRRVLQHPTELRWRLFHEFLGKLDRYL